MRHGKPCLIASGLLPSTNGYGSIFYACYFIVSVPLVANLDEEGSGPGEDPTPPLGRVCLESLGAGMLAFILLDAWALLLGPLTP